MNNEYNFKHPYSKKITYITDRKIISGSNFIEYDIKQANINILKAYNMLDDHEYYMLKNADKQAREIIIGNKIRLESYNSNKSKTAEVIKEGISIMKDMLLSYNNIKADNIIRIANDAVYIETPIPLHQTSFELNGNSIVEFLPKNDFSSFINLQKILVFLKIHDDENIVVDIKGISDELLNLHQSFLEFICEILFHLERTDKETTLMIFNNFYSRYINMDLDISYYREFNSDSAFRIKSNSKFYAARYLDNSHKDKIDINYNLMILREIYSFILSLK